MLLTPVYRLRVYAPRSVDATETTLLTPAAAAPHAEPFRVASVAGVTGYRPFLSAPQGRRGRFDPLTKRVDTGEMTFTVFDRRVDGGTNAQRWLTAFAGDVEGKPALLNCRAEADESLDGGATWDPFFAGRIEAFAFDDVLQGTITVREESKRFDEQLFVGRPHASVSYARTMAALPVQPPPPLSATYRRFAGTVAHTAEGFFNVLLADSATKLRGNVVSSALTAFAVREWNDGYSAEDGALRGFFQAFGTVSSPGGVAQLNGSKIRALVTWSGGSGEYPVWLVSSTQGDDDEYYRPFRIRCALYPAGASGYAARPANGTAVEIVLVVDAPASKDAPIILEATDPLTVWQDVLAGRFGRLNVDGTIRRAIAADTAAFAALAASRTFLPLTAKLEKPITVREFLEQYILRPYHLGYRLSPTGAVVPFDCRRDSSLAAVPVLGPSDLAAPDKGFGWAQQRSDAVATIRLEAFRDRAVATEELVKRGDRPILRSPAGTLTTYPLTVIDADLSARALDVTTEELVIDAPGWRVREQGTQKLVANGGDADDTTAKPDEAIIAAALGLTGQLRALFGPGSTRTVRAFRRTSAGDVLPGMWRRLTVPEAPNAASFTRGGERVGLCLDRIEDGPFVQLEFLDAGASSVAVAPALASLSVAASGVPTVSITRNAANDPVLVEYALTSQAVGTPPTTGWRDAGLAAANGSFTLPTVPSGLRLWVRARSEPHTTGDLFQLPSPTVAPVPAYADTGTELAPSGVGLSSIGRTVATVSWTNGDASAPVELLLATGSYAAGLFDAAGLVLAVLPAGSTTYVLTGLNGPSVAHCVAVRHVRPGTGRFSAVAYANFTTGTTDPQLARPAGLVIAAPLG